MLLHGFAGGPESWCGLKAFLPGNQAVLTPTLLGHGLHHEGRAPDTWNFHEQVSVLAEHVRASKGSPVDVVGYSLGARLALALIVEYPGLLRSATLVGVHPGLVNETERRERQNADERWATMLEYDGLDEFVRAWSSQEIFRDQATRLPAQVLEAQDAIRHAHDARSLAQAMRVFSLARMPSFWPELTGDSTKTSSANKTPVCIVVGERDAKFRRIAERMYASASKQAGLLEPTSSRLVIVPDSGHNVVLEAPQRLAQIMTDFVASIAEVRR